MKNLQLLLSILMISPTLCAQHELKISASHLVAQQNSYDNKTHRYNPDYVKPKGYLLIFRIPSLVLPSKPVGWIKPDYEEPGDNIKPVENPALKEEVKRYNEAEKYINSIKTLSIITRLKGGSFLSRIDKHVSLHYNGQESVTVPTTGTYEVDYTILFRDGKQIRTNRSFTIKDFLVVAMGDSYASGEGNPDVKANLSAKVRMNCNTSVLYKKMLDDGNIGFGMLIGFQSVVGIIKGFLINDSQNTPPKWLEPLAHRSYINGSYVAASNLAKSSPNEVTLIRHLNFARSGAQIEQGLLAPNSITGQDNWAKVGQVEEAKRTLGNLPIDALIISIGGNDIGFAGCLANLTIEAKLTEQTENNSEKARNTIRQETMFAINALPEAYTKLRQALQPLRIKKVYLTEYPTRFYEKVDGQGNSYDGGECGVLSNPGLNKNNTFDQQDGLLFKELGTELNKTIRAVASALNWEYVDGIDQDFAGHGYCESKSETFYVRAEESCLCQADFDGMCHPNRKGHEVYAKHILRKLRENTPFNNPLPTAQSVTIGVIETAPVKK